MNFRNLTKHTENKLTTLHERVSENVFEKIILASLLKITQSIVSAAPRPMTSVMEGGI